MFALERKSSRSLMLALMLVVLTATAWAKENSLAAYSVEELWHMTRQLAPYTANRIDRPYLGTEPELTHIPTGMAYLQQTRHGMTSAIPRPVFNTDEDAALKIAILNEIIAQDPEAHWIQLAQWELGLTHLALRRFEEGISYLELASGSGLVHGKYVGDLANAYEYMGALDKAEQVLRLELERANNPALRFQLATLLEKQNRLQEAHELYREVLEHEDLYPSARDAINQRIERVTQLEQSGKSLGRIQGSVLLNGEGVGGVQVVITIDSSVVSSYPRVVATTFTRPDGNFELFGVPEGHYRIGVFVPTHLAEGSSVQFVPSLISLDAGEQARADVRFERRTVIGRSIP